MVKAFSVTFLPDSEYQKVEVLDYSNRDIVQTNKANLKRLTIKELKKLYRTNKLTGGFKRLVIDELNKRGAKIKIPKGHKPFEPYPQITVKKRNYLEDNPVGKSKISDKAEREREMILEARRDTK